METGRCRLTSWHIVKTVHYSDTFNTLCVIAASVHQPAMSTDESTIDFVRKAYLMAQYDTTLCIKFPVTIHRFPITLRLHPVVHRQAGVPVSDITSLLLNKYPISSDTSHHIIHQFAPEASNVGFVYLTNMVLLRILVSCDQPDNAHRPIKLQLRYRLNISGFLKQVRYWYQFGNSHPRLISSFTSNVNMKPHSDN